MLGMLPWLMAGVGDGWATLRVGQATSLSGSYGHRLNVEFTHVLPMAFGARVEGVGVWLVNRDIGVLAYAAALFLVVAACVVLWQRVVLARVLVLFCVAFPFLYAMFPTSWFWNDGRYVIFLTPVVSLVVMGAVGTIDFAPARHSIPRHSSGVRIAVASRRKTTTALLLSSGLLVVATASTLWAVNSGFGVVSSPSKLISWHANPDPKLEDVERRLTQMGVHTAYAEYWVAYDVEFLSDGHLTVSAVDDNRNVAERSAVDRAPRSAWIFVLTDADAESELGTGGDLNPPGVSVTSLTSWLSLHDIPYKTLSRGPYTVVVPARQVTPADIGAPTGVIDMTKT